jgi:hypothetical protein
MTIFTSRRPVVWGELDVPMFGLARDMHDAPLQAPVAFSVVMDEWRLWLMVNHRQAARIHPQARPGKFQAELWRHDVAELFLADPVSGRYFEFNLAANGAWWSCEFTAPRVRADEVDIAMPEVATFSDMAPDGSWLAAMAIPLELLRARLDFGPRTLMNVTMILESPEQNQPSRFSGIDFVPLPE